MAQEHQDAPNEGGDNTKMMTDVTFPSIGEEETPATPDEDSVQAQLRKMEERFEQNQQAFEAERARWQQTVDRLIQTQQTLQPRQEPERPQQQPVDFSDLPDPVDKPDDFKKALAERFERQMSERMTSTLSQYQQQNTQQQTRQQAFDAMWNKFQQDYADLADKTTTLKGAIISEREALQARGVDPQQAILADPDGFMQRVANSMRQELGTTAPEPQAPGSAPAQEPQRPAANRTGGVGGGTNTGGTGGGKAKQPPQFSEQLKKMQLDSGLI